MEMEGGDLEDFMDAGKTTDATEKQADGEFGFNTNESGLNFNNDDGFGGQDPFKADGMQMSSQNDLNNGFGNMNFASAPIPGQPSADDYNEEELAIIARVQEEEQSRRKETYEK